MGFLWLLLVLAIAATCALAVVATIGGPLYLKGRCPTCFEQLYLGDAPSRSMSPVGPQEPDDGLGDFLHIQPSPSMRRVEPVPATGLVGRWLRRLWLPHDPASDRKKVCPRCHLYLPHKMASGELQSEILAIVGARNAGKSNYFGVLINALERRYAEEVGFSMFAQDTFSVRDMQPVSSRDLYKARYGARLFSSQPTALNSTPSAATNPDILIPLIYRMQFPLQPEQRITRPFSHFRALDLVVFDAAGEDLQNTVTRQQFTRYVGAASGIIFLIDPFAFPGIAELLPPSVRASLPQQGDAREVISGAINLFEERNRLRADQKIRVPVAVAFTKTDMLKNIVEPDSPILRDSRHEGGFNEGDCQECSEEVERYLCDWGCSDLSRLVRSRFKDSQFFAVSALGQMPGQNSCLGTISPRRIADPLLWLLWKRGYISRSPA
jgi:hypothetical protein